MRMSARHRAALSATRGSLLAVTSATLSVTAHVLADGELSDPALTVLLTGLIGWIATALAGKARGPVATLALLGAGQVVMHLVLVTLAGHDMYGMPGRAGGLTMLAAHAIATLLTALLLAKADAMLLAVLSAVRAILPWLLPALPVPAAAPVAMPARTDVPPHLVGVDLRRIHGRRGPPVTS
jgi:hypothetical protein